MFRYCVTIGNVIETATGRYVAGDLIQPSEFPTAVIDHWLALKILKRVDVYEGKIAERNLWAVGPIPA